MVTSGNLPPDRAKFVYFKTFYKKDRIDNEVEIHGSLDHPNIVKMISNFRDETKICMVLEFCPDRTIGDLMKTYDDKVCSSCHEIPYLGFILFYSVPSRKTSCYPLC